ncbi:hypothetical protein AtubIFM55763_003202 [Aspergillus tubingensis]|uniref:Uncharacterized protein n=1 Tax=Aspergillus tubingensis TaxID=5068 RepID=A0A8H3SNJ3_ASPTU|nr:membrane bound O-acyl transferase family-domain-containing protein [Aspergillus tubingensis]GFN12541.1 membrane bound O-acyl transferase family-domain-containing protein [Aspergillus tubingensis]GLA68136.1 hypothetical protein AtubIFM55763_003202 [Aspergillus tubingensis]GLA86326.1 hypothetical protein AtubIFM56815_010585 [Aspergillus tubingensis]
MDIVASLYPALSERKPLPTYYTPGCLGLALVPFLVENKGFSAFSTWPFLLYLCASWPCFTTGDPSSDYYNNSQFIAFPLWYLDFVFLTPRDGKDAPAFIGRQLTDEERGDEGGVITAQGQCWKDLTTFSQRVKWAFRLMLPVHRGIGWNWQVKGVPADPHAKLPRWQYVGWQMWWVVFYYVQSMGTLAGLGLGCALRAQIRSDELLKTVVVNAIVGWLGAVWIWDRLNCAYRLAAALGVATGATETWEWPPLMGPLKDAWSVRQMWSATYHQVCRRLLSQPSKRLVRFLRLRKGGLASSYSQLFISFGISCLFHQAQMFNVTRRDMGELAFFMSQPLAIVVEDLVRWAWKKTGISGKSIYFEKVVGYSWTFVWFSMSLHLYISGLVQARVMKDWLFGYTPLEIGADARQQLLMWLRV